MDAKYAKDPRVASAASAGVAWAMRFMSKGWQSLSPKQKRAARSALGIVAAPVVLQPVRARGTARVAQPNKRGPGLAGKSMTITKCEYLDDVVTQEGALPKFVNWTINLRMVRTFPQTSLMASQFNKYRLTGLSVRYTATCSFETSGRVAIGFTNDSSDPIPDTKVQLYNYPVHAETGATESKTLVIPCDNVARFCRDDGASDPKLVDFGRLVLCTYGSAAGGPSTLGELFIEYTIVFTDPTFTSSLTQVGEFRQSKGPRYALVNYDTTNFQLTLLAAGRWLVCWVSSSAIPSPSVNGAGAKGSLTTSGDSKMCVGLITTQAPGANITSTTIAAPTGLSWYVARL
uniref:Capsid protein n=1 Tax=Saguaro cactus virus TaxID=52274 RepID=A0A2R4KNI7_9TOMB|nr:capsid protein [Saguaro cactus virus]